MPSALLTDLSDLFMLESAHAPDEAEADRLATIADELAARTTFAKRCRCGAVHDAAAWLALPVVGVQHFDDEDPPIELRNCPCGSTLGVELVSATEAA